MIIARLDQIISWHAEMFVGVAQRDDDASLIRSAAGRCGLKPQQANLRTCTARGWLRMSAPRVDGQRNA